MDSDSEDERPLVRSSCVPPNVLAALEHDLREEHDQWPAKVAPADPSAPGRAMGVVDVVDTAPQGLSRQDQVLESNLTPRRQ